MTTSYDEELKLEQKYFDAAWDAREATRATLGGAHEQAGGNRRVQGAVNKAARERMESLGTPDEAVAVGKFQQDGETLYVGKHAISNAERDKLVISWQASAAEPYYQARIEDPLGVDFVRKFSTTKNTIDDFQDLVFSDLARRVDELTREQRIGVDDALLRDLESSRDGAMRDIVQTIHHSQDDIIRTSPEQLLVVQGGPGTGKTVVALHRVSWLLFNFRDIRPEDVLVIGPSRTFTRYIGQVLPGLGDEGVASEQLTTLGPKVPNGRNEEPDVARLKGEDRMAMLLRRALRRRIRFPRGEDVLAVGPGQGVKLTKAEVVAQLDRLRDSSTYATGRVGMRQWLNERARQLLPANVTIQPSHIDNALERVWPQLTAQAFLQELFSSQRQLADAAGDDFTAGDIVRLHRQATDKLANESWSIADIALLDEVDSLINGRSTRYQHIVVDEAQDLSPMQLRSIKRRSANGSYTVVGDIAQSTGPWARDSWDDIVSALEDKAPTKIAELEYGYRVPRQIFEFAARLLAVAAPAVTPPQVVRDGPSDPELLPVELEDLARATVQRASSYAGKGLFVGIICPERHRAAVVEELHRADVLYDDAGDGQLGKSINLLTPEQAKGLEFEAAVVVEPADIAAGTKAGHRLLYVALTRTTKHVSVCHHRELSLLDLTGEASEDGSDTADDLNGSTFHHAAEATVIRRRRRPHRRTAAELLAHEMAGEVIDQLPPVAWAEFLAALSERLSDTETAT